MAKASRAAKPPYLYEFLGIEIPLGTDEIDRIFWDAASPGIPTDGMPEFLTFLKKKGIRTGVISNITYAQSVVAERITRLLPNHEFEFILTSSQYIFRKPHQRIFQLALKKANLPAEEVWYIGDNYLCDIEGVLTAGITPVWYTGAFEGTEDDKAAYADRSDKAGCLRIKEWNELAIKLDQLQMK